MNNTNLLEETLSVIERENKAPSDIIWIGTSDGATIISWEDFKHLANFYYDNGYGHQEVMLNLVVVGENWWLERAEYDGSEWWRFNTIPTLAQGKLKVLTTLKSNWP